MGSLIKKIFLRKQLGDMIKKIDSNEIEKFIKLEEEAFSEFWSLETYQNLCKNYQTQMFVYIKEEKCIAYAVFLDMADVYELVKIAVKKEFRGQKNGIYFLKEIVMKLDKNIFLEVRENNKAAINLYEHAGFKKINIRKNYYRDTGENALIMTYEK